MSEFQVATKQNPLMQGPNAPPAPPARKKPSRQAVQAASRTLLGIPSR
jgi:hypothetical protein